MLLIKRLLLSKYSRPIFLASIAVFVVKIVQNIKRALYFVMRKLFCLKIVFLLDTKGLILKQKELFNELVKGSLEGLLRPQCCSLTDFYCQNIQGQFFRRLLQFFL